MRHTTIPQWACALLLLGACRLSPLAEEQAGLPPGAEDGDGDGYASIASGGDDCDDGDDSIHPGAAEVCGDGLDNNCDGAIDDQGEGNVVGYLDRDEDGYGDPDTRREACPQALKRDGYVTEAGDCADTNPSVKPGQPDFCNGVDDDCDNAVDEDELARVGDDVFTDWPSALAHAREAGGSRTVLEVCPRDTPVETETIRWDSPGELVIEGRGQSRSDVVLQHVSGGRIAEVHDGELVFRSLSLQGSARDRAVVVREGGRLRLENTHLTDNRAGALSLHGRLFSGEQSVLAYARLDQGTSVTGNGHPDLPQGGGVVASGAYELEIDDTTLSGNEARDGGGLFVGPLAGNALYASVTTITSSTFVDNVASDQGGGILAELHEVRVEDVTVSGNAASYGAGVFLWRTFLTGTCDGSIPTSTITDNRASESGGGLYLMADSDAFCVSMTENEAEGMGGGVYVHRNNVAALSSCIVRDNDADLGGGIRVESGVLLDISDTELDGNRATIDGGGLDIDVANGTVVTLDRVSFSPKGRSRNQPQDISAGGREYDYASKTSHDVRCDANGCSFQ